MATKNIVPRATGEGGIGTALKHWLTGFIDKITAGKITNTDGNDYARIVRGSTQPTDTSVLWLDTTTSPYILKWYDTTNSAWVSYVSGADNANSVTSCGIGVNVAPQPTNFNNVTKSGFYLATATALNSPASGYYYVIIHLAVTANNAVQVAYSVIYDTVYIRSNANGTWSNWTKLH